jgi:flagellar protein FliL
MSQEAQTPAAPAPKKSRKLMVIAGAILVIAGISGGGYWMFLRPSAEAAEKPAEEPAEPPAIVSMDPFVVNLADPGAARFLRVTVGLVVANEGQAKEFSEDAVVRMRVRSSILDLLAQQTAEHLVTTEGKTELKNIIAERVLEHTEHLKISDVLFSEFIVQ